ncbi:small lysine-rich protein 1-like [Teleopsis dalmanni]|uniref:small lysine-rich protein 1-like n=1 Tax=Teleopsis dalmanni TaxID=139649 RepID=UPI0018CEE21F|nr:small lysine-rich protein 1-like [Teleopsis dalmanni]XP_037948871.1 small lysine-rich protein 1-like [Teleopsis dalmanni]
MGAKAKKKRNSKDSTASNNEETTEKKEGGKKKTGGGSKSVGCDILNDAAMENAYYVCHNVQDVLKARGFAWPDGQKKKKKGKR